MMLDDFDPIIDDVAREMTSAPADANLARRVAARIAHGDVRRRGAWMRPVVLTPIAAACVIVVAVLVVRDKKPLVPVPAPVVAVAPERTTAQQVEPVSEPRPTRASVRRPRAVPLPAVQEMDVMPIVVDRVDVAPIVRAEQIEIDPIAITRIEISPMP
jgi:hypothetical protein